MADIGVENNLGSQGVEKQIRLKVDGQSAEQLKQELDKMKDNADAAKIAIELALTNENHPNPQHHFAGSKEEKDSPKGKISSLKELIQKIFVAAKVSPEKVPAADKPAQTDPKAPLLTPKSTELIKKLGEKISLDDIESQDGAAPYIYDILRGITDGSIKSSEDLSRKVHELNDTVRFTSPSIYKKLQDAGVSYAKETGHEEKEARKMFGVPEAAANTEEYYENQKKAAEEAAAQSNFNQSWGHIFSGFFDEGHDKTLVRALYSPSKFIEYYEGLKKEVSDGKTLTVEQIDKKASSEMEVKISLLFAKLYQKLDHEKPSEYFQTIEQEDIMKGITPVKAEIKRRLSRLANDLHHYKGAEDIHFYRALEQDTKTASIDMGGGKVKPRTRLVLKLQPTKSHGGDFAHYLDQIADHYIDARRYTHNARAILLRPGEPGKGFYTQLAHFAGETSQLDFDQMMLLPDNDIFQTAFGLYNKMVEQGFAKTDWRHSAGMFMSKANQHTTQIEERVLKQLEVMFSDRPEVDRSRLEAALTMAVGASRGMFLTEQEMASHAEPHLDEKGGSTFTSYYHQDATALMAFNPQHLLARFAGGPNLLDPIFFLPVSSFQGSQSFNDHKELWDKAAKYKKSFLEGRGKLPEKTFYDTLDNIGLIGGPAQRKGWRSQWQFDSLYVTDKVEVSDSKGKLKNVADKINFVKSFKYFENIGYELLQDYVSKLDFLDGDFAKIRNTHGLDKHKQRLVDQKKELFEHVFTKYFNQDPKDLNKYLDKIRGAQRITLMDKIRKGILAPDNIDDAVEAATTTAFLDRMLARVITKRLPSKLLRMDRDRYSKDGTSRYRKVMRDMGLESEPDAFDNIMQDMILAEQMLRRNVSTKMRAMRDTDGAKDKYGDINYEMTPQAINELLKPLIANGKMDQKRLDNVLKLFGHIKTNYIDFTYTEGAHKGKSFIDVDLVPYFKSGGAAARESKYTIALDETDLSFIPFRGGGESVLKRSISDIAAVEENVSKPLMELVKKLRDMAINGKKDFSPITEIISKVYFALDGIIGPQYANELASNIAAMTVMYMKKDTQARALMGAFGVGRFNSMAAENAGKKNGVWEWDSSVIDAFFTDLEMRGVINSTPYNTGQEPGKESLYVNIPFKKEPTKLPEKIETSKIAELLGGKDGKFEFFGKTITIPDIPLFYRRRHDYQVWSKQLRDKYGGTKFDMFFDMVNKYLPFVAIFILWNLIKKAFEDSEGKKK